MKSTALKCLVFFGFILFLRADDAVNFPLSTNETAVVKRKLEAYQNEKLTLDNLTINGGEEGCQELMSYYLSHPNDVSVKMKLPISRSFAAFNKFEEAAKLSAEYVQVYSNDWHGWKIWGGANFEIGNYGAAIKGLANSAKLGDDGSYAALGLAALRAERLDAFQSIIPHLFTLKQSPPTKEINSLDIVMLLAAYSLRVNHQDLFIKALDGVTAKQMLSRDDLTCLVKSGCERFKGADIDKIREELKAAETSNSNGTNSRSP